jgi:hypothetical protein
MKSTLFSYLMVLCAFQVHSQTIQIDWDNTIGGNCGDCARNIIRLSDGGFVIVGISCSEVSYDKTEPPFGGAPDMDVWVLRTDAQSEIIWQRTIGGTSQESGTSVIETSDGGFLIGALSQSGVSGLKTESNRGGYDYWVIKLDASGNIEWDKTIGGAGHEDLRFALETPDGGFLLAGHSDSYLISGDKDVANFGNTDVWLVKLTQNREIEWQQVYGGDQIDQLGMRSVEVDVSGNIFLGANSRSGISGNKTEPNNGNYDYWVLKLNPNGDILWQKSIGGTGDDTPEQLIFLHEEEMLIVGESNSEISGDKSENSFGESDYWIVRLSGNGELISDKTIGGAERDVVYVAGRGEPFGIVLAGTSLSGISGLKTEQSRGNWDYWIVGVDDNMNILWQKTIGGSDVDFLYGMTLTDDGIVLAGCSDSPNSGEKTEPNLNDPEYSMGDYWLVKLISDEVVGTENAPNSKFYIGPNPFEQGLTVRSSHTSEPLSIRITDIVGNEVYRVSAVSEHQIQSNDWPSGVYLFQITGVGTSEVMKVVRY